MSAYARLARLPQPRLGPVDVAAWVQRVVALETRLDVATRDGPPAILAADGDQLDQLLINLVRNAVDARLETKGGVRVGWTIAGGVVEVTVEDDGPGLPDPGNLFVRSLPPRRLARVSDWCYASDRGSAWWRRLSQASHRCEGRTSAAQVAVGPAAHEPGKLMPTCF